jgi:hypothetical protein
MNLGESAINGTDFCQMSRQLESDVLSPLSLYLLTLLRDSLREFAKPSPANRRADVIGKTARAKVIAD